MASDPSFVAFVCDQLRAAGKIASRKMFGEYAIYCGDKVVALVCDNRFFLKPTPAGRAALANPTEASPYPGAKLHFALEAELDDAERLAELVRLTAASLPVPKPKTPRGKKPSSK